MMLYKAGVAACWKTGDVIDLEYLLERDADAFENELRDRDRAIYRSLRPDAGHDPLPPREALFGWLTHRRATGGVLPGHAVSQGWHMAGWVVGLLGLLAGGSVAGGLLRYTGERPINIDILFAVLVVFQVLSLVVMAVGFLVRRFRPATPPGGLPTRLIRWLAARSAALVGDRLGAGRKAAWKTYAGLFTRFQRLYGKPFFWQVFTRLQTFGVTFNLGALGMMLFRVLTSDLAFGWQSTLRAGDEQVYRLARAVAAPWAWLAGEGAGYPSLAAVEGSRIVLKDGIYHLSSEHLAAWWPFLCFAVICYGLLPRVVLYVFSCWMQRRAFAGLTFRHAAAERLYRRMTVPLLATRHGAEISDEARPAPAPVAGRLAPSPEGGCILLVTHDLLAAVGPEGLRGWMGRHALPGERPIPFGRDVAEDREALVALRMALANTGGAPVCLIYEAWQPPILETQEFIAEVRSAAGDQGAVWIVLAGRVREDGAVGSPREHETAVWTDAVNGMGDPYLGMLQGGGDDVG
jgi:hypothetical protein